MFPGIHALTTPNKPALIMATSGLEVTYAQLEERSLRIANWLRSKGFQRGDVVALLSDNDPRVFDVYWAAQRAGLYITSVNFHLRSDEVRYILENSGAKCLFLGNIGADLNAVWNDLPSLQYRVSFSSGVQGFESMEQILESSSTARPAYEPRGADMLYSSGTTGRPKGVRPPLPERQVSEPGDTMVSMFSGHFGCNKDTVYLSPAPLYHAAPLRTCASVQALGGTAVVMDKFDPETALGAIEKYKITVSQWVPTMFVRMLKLDPSVRARYDVSSMKVAIHAAAPCPMDVKHQMIEWWGPVLYEYYSCTEVNGMTIIRPQDWLQKPGSVGKAALGTIHICDDAGQELRTGEDGLVYFERDIMPFAYHGDPEKTRSTQHPEHPTWTTVGDIGHVDSDEFLFLTDRKAFMIISGGVNIYPQEIENALALHPAILDIAVIGVPDAEMGEQVKAVVTLASGYKPTAELAQEIIDFTKSKVASYKAPKTVDFVKTLPRTPTGKLLKGEVRKTYWPAKT
ncbi:MAG: acyl-CoA synthetase [Sulfuricaulis sp.]|nr:acyl-CoA synthetase [Sulfuricaulis sp.]